MELPKQYNSAATEQRLHEFWQQAGVNHFDPASAAPVYAIDTPPPTVSGRLHIGHVYSYSHADFMARFWRMNGHNVYYPMGYDDNGLPTERLVERMVGGSAAQLGRQAFIAECLRLSEEIVQDYRTLWERLGLSIDWRYTYRTIEDRARQISQWSFLDLYRKNLVYRAHAPTIWCPLCQTAIAQAEVNDLARESEFVTLAFTLAAGSTLPIATTRPELLPACVAVFVHPEDERFCHLIGQEVITPLWGRRVPLLADPGADPQKGTGAVMCCTFGDATDVIWWRTHNLSLRMVIGTDGRLTEAAEAFAGQTIADARQAIIAALAEHGLLLHRRPVEQTVRVHERCDTPVETLVTPQWYIRVLERKAELLAAGEQIEWQPPHTAGVYRTWVENLAWDWCISRQRYFGVPIPVWYCNACGNPLVADETQLPVDPTVQAPPRPCACGSTDFTPETDVFDTWATSSLSPQIGSRWLEDAELYSQLFPVALRSQAHEIIRTWAFYTIVKSLYHFGVLPWRTAFISGWGLAPQGMGKISKSRGGGPIAPLVAIERYSADAVRYWAASTGPGKDAIISEEKMQTGAKLVTKLWNVARLSQPFVTGIPTSSAEQPTFSPADRWIQARTRQLVQRVTTAFHGYDYAVAKHEIEVFFWTDFTDNYLEMAKQRLYHADSASHTGARATLANVLLTLLKIFAPFLPYVTEEIYQHLFVSAGESIHTSGWPQSNVANGDAAAILGGETLMRVATAVRRYKSEHKLALGAELAEVSLATAEPALGVLFHDALEDLKSVTRAQTIQIGTQLTEGFTPIWAESTLAVACRALSHRGDLQAPLVGQEK